jgi:hypothetical protein
MKAIAASVCKLISTGMLKPCELESNNRLVLDTNVLLRHYRNLEEELRKVGRPFYYSRGEYFFQMTIIGREEWQKEEYRPFYEK